MERKRLFCVYAPEIIRGIMVDPVAFAIYYQVMQQEGKNLRSAIYSLIDQYINIQEEAKRIREELIKKDS